MKGSFMTRNLLLLLLIAMVVLSGCGTSADKSAPTASSQTTVQPGSIAAGYLTEFSSMGPRTAGTDKEAAAAVWIAATLEGLGYTVTKEPFEYEMEGTKFKSENIIAVKAGKTDQTVILGAHYDSVDVGNGVDDNASGIAVVMEAANVMKDVETPQTLEFIFFGAEEAGLCGSAYHVKHMTPDAVEKTILMMNYDSLVAGETAYVYGTAGAAGKFRDNILNIAADKKLTLITQPGENPDYPAGTTGDWSDHAAFKTAGIPYVYFESTNWKLGAQDGYTQVDTSLGVNGEIWHTKYDTKDYINKNFPGRINERLTVFSTVTEAFLAEDLSKL